MFTNKCNNTYKCCKKIRSIAITLTENSFSNLYGHHSVILPACDELNKHHERMDNQISDLAKLIVKTLHEPMRVTLPEIYYINNTYTGNGKSDMI